MRLSGSSENRVDFSSSTFYFHFGPDKNNFRG